MRKALRFKIKQPSAHYRDPKVFQNDYISTLNLPTRTSILGMITYLCDKRLSSDVDGKSSINIGVIGTYRNKAVEFSRGEKMDFWDNYRKLKGSKEREKFLKYGEYYDFYKNYKAENSILNYEVLRDVELSIFFSCDDEEEYLLVKRSLENPGKYMNLGRKEDFVVPYTKGEFVEEVELLETFSTSTRDAVKNKLKLKNSYIKVDLKEHEKYEEILNSGTLIALPRKYKDIKDMKENRTMEFCHYIYIGEEGIYPKNLKVNVYDNGESKEVFTWL